MKIVFDDAYAGNETELGQVAVNVDFEVSRFAEADVLSRKDASWAMGGTFEDLDFIYSSFDWLAENILCRSESAGHLADSSLFIRSGKERINF